MPKIPRPVTFSAESIRRVDLPSNVNRLASFSGTSFGAGSLAAASTSYP